MKYLRRILRIMFGLLLFGFGSYLSIQANVGLAPWEAFQLGIANLIGVKYGNVSVTVGLIILVASLALKEKVGIGTVLNLIFIGKFVDMFNALDLVPQMQRFLPGVGMLLLGLLSVSVGSYFYISGGMGCGPRDALMVALHKRIKGLPVGAIRGIIEGTVLLIGFLLGSKVGLGTVISVFGISFLIQGVFHVFRFDVKAVEHEGFRETWNAIRSREKTQ